MTTEGSVSIKISDMRGVTEYAENAGVDLWHDGDSGRLVVCAYNQAGCDGVMIDLRDTLDWFRRGPNEVMETANGRQYIAFGPNPG